MTSRAGGANGAGSRPNRRPPRRPGSRPARQGHGAVKTRRPAPRTPFKILEKSKTTATVGSTEQSTAAERQPFRVLIAIHRPRYRGRAVRASALVGWEVTALLNKQDVVGQVAKLPGRPIWCCFRGILGGSEIMPSSGPYSRGGERA